MNFDDILLEKEQEDLLIALVEAARKQPREQRYKFVFIPTLSDSIIMGLDDYPNPYKGDVEILGQERLLNTSYTSKDTLQFDVLPRGFRYYEHLMKSRGEAVERVEGILFRYLDASGFGQRHPDAFAKWKQAEELLWSSDSASQHTAIGHHCREAMQLFATSLGEAHQLSDVGSNPAQTVNRVRAVLDQAKTTKSGGIIDMLDALLSYWGTTSDLAQRQEHGGQKEGQPLNWEDSRRLVFHTVLVMTEIDRVLYEL